MGYQILLFDLDGTLLDFDASEQAALKKLFVSKGLNKIDDVICTYKKVNNGLWRSYEKGEIVMSELVNTRFSKTMNNFGMYIDGEAWEKEYRSYLANYAFIIEGADEILKNLSVKHRMFAITNGVGDTQKNRLKLAGLIDYFEDIFISQIIGVQKPDIRFFEYVMNNIRDFNKNKSIVIGDSVIADIQGGNNAGLDTCLVNTDGRIYDESIVRTYEISSLKELYKICS